MTDQPDRSKPCAAAKQQGFSDQTLYEAWAKRQWADLEAAAIASEAAYAAKQAFNERARAVSWFWAAVAAEAQRLLPAEEVTTAAADFKPFVISGATSDD